MGIKSNYMKTLISLTNGTDSITRIHISKFCFEKIAIDSTLYLYKFKAALGDRWLTGVINLIKCMRTNNIHCVFIFDGKSPVQKQEEQQDRKNNKRKLENFIQELENDVVKFNNTGNISDNLSKLNKEGQFNIDSINEKIEKKKNQVFDVTRSDFILLKELLTVLKIPFYTAPSEAEKFCAKLCIDEKVKAVLSDDTDVIAYRTPLSLSKVNTMTGECVMVQSKKLLESMNFTNEQFLDHCIMCGTDYNKNIKGIGSMTSYKLLKDHDNIDNIKENLKMDVSCLNHQIVRKLFTDFEDYNIDYIPYCGKVDPEDLKNFINKNKLKINTSTLLSSLCVDNVKIDF